MSGFFSGKLALSVILAGALSVQSACSGDPVSPGSAEKPSFASGFVLTVGGPSSITATGTYTYGAHFGAPYARFSWWTRTCTTATVASCTTAWLGAADVVQLDPWRTQIRRRLTYNCGFKAPVSFQVKVTASGFGVPAQTGYKVTQLCGVGPL